MLAHHHIARFLPKAHRARIDKVIPRIGYDNEIAPAGIGGRRFKIRRLCGAVNFVVFFGGFEVLVNGLSSRCIPEVEVGQRAIVDGHVLVFVFNRFNGQKVFNGHFRHAVIGHKNHVYRQLQ